jgi:hypothetical protein
MLNYSLPCSCSQNLSSFWLILKQQWTIEEISIFSNSSHLEWRAGLSDTILKGNAILYKTNTYIFALRKTTTTQLTVNNIFISILFDFRIWIIQPGTVAMAISAHGSH